MLNFITLWNMVHLEAALAGLRADCYPLRDDDLARPSPHVRRHLNVHGHSFLLPEP